MLVATVADCDTPSDRSSFWPYVKLTVVLIPLGFTTAFNVARVPDTDVAAEVLAVGLIPAIVNDRDTSDAAVKIPKLPRDATMVQVPGDT